MSVDRKGQGVENRWVWGPRGHTGLLGEERYSLCGQEEDVDQWTNELASVEAVVTLMRLRMVGQFGERMAGEGGGTMKAGTLV